MDSKLWTYILFDIISYGDTINETFTVPDI